jgi:hypothetical protein
MRCLQCGWVASGKGCPCGYASKMQFKPMVPVGTRVAFRFGRGPSMPFWTTGDVVAHQGKLHQVSTKTASYWCEVNDLMPESPVREQGLKDGTRVWALWLDGRWFPGVIDACEGPLRHVAWDDGDQMWLEAYQMVVMAADARSPEEGDIVLAKHWNGDVQPARVEQRDGARFKVVFRDGEESWLPGDDLTTFPPNPFMGD